MPGTHAPIAPSSLALTVACNASVQLQAAAPELPDTDEEAEGTAAHLVAMAHAAGHAELWQLGRKFESGGRTFEVDVDMFNGAQLWARTMRDPAMFGAELRTEEPVRVSRIHETACYGTLDARRYFSVGIGPQGKPVLRVGDYKYGFRFVDAYECWQLMAYAEGVIELLDLHDEDMILELIIVQPRSFTREGPVRTWRIPATALRPYINIAHAAAHAALGPDPTATTGAHCIDCKARHICATLQRATTNLVDYSARGELNPLSPQALGQELRILDAASQRLDARRTALAAHAEALIRAGHPVSFYELAPGRSTLKWLDTLKPEDIVGIGAMMGVDIRKPLAAFTPRQAIDAGISEEVIASFASRPPAALKLQPISTTATRKLFGANRT